MKEHNSADDEMYAAYADEDVTISRPSEAEDVEEYKKYIDGFSSGITVKEEILESDPPGTAAFNADEETYEIKDASGTTRRITAGGLTGSSVLASSVATHHSGPFASGGFIGTGPGYPHTAPLPSTFPWPTTTGTGTTFGPATPAAPAKKSLKDRMVRLPQRFTEKVLLAFLDEDEPDAKKDVVWAANLKVERVEMTLEGGETKLVVVLSMEDHYDNNPKPEED